jgi:hypothetical protein
MQRCPLADRAGGERGGDAVRLYEGRKDWLGFALWALCTTGAVFAALALSGADEWHTLLYAGVILAIGSPAFLLGRGRRHLGAILDHATLTQLHHSRNAQIAQLEAECAKREKAIRELRARMDLMGMDQAAVWEIFRQVCQDKGIPVPDLETTLPVLRAVGS